MTKNVFLVDSELSIVDNIVGIPNQNLCGVFVNSTVEKERVMQKYPELKVFIFSDIIDWKITHVSTTDIKRYVATQLKCERDLSRYLNVYGQISSHYYHALAFWLYVFNNYHIDCLIVAQAEHGCISDSIPLDIATSRDIPAYTIDPLYANSKNIYSGIKDHKTGKYLNLLSLSPNKSKISLLEVMNQDNNISNSDVDERISAVPIPSIRKLIKYFFVVYGNVLRVIGKNTRDILKSQIEIYELLYKFYFWINVLLNRTELPKVGIPRKHSYHEFARQLKSLKKRNKYYSSHAVSQISNEKNSIVYALHFEPEASILNRTTYNSQLYNITMLSNLLPDGWILYVKEHPHQINLLTSKKNWYLHKADCYKSQEYYSQLLELPNVELLDYNITSGSILKEYAGNGIGLKAIATINGTISLEALEKNIPVILFDFGSTAYSSEISNIHVVEDSNSLRLCISKIATMGAVSECDKNQLSKITEYLFRFKHDDISEILTNLIYSTQTD